MSISRWHLTAGVLSLSLGAAGYVLHTPAGHHVAAQARTLPPPSLPEVEPEERVIQFTIPTRRPAGLTVEQPQPPVAADPRDRVEPPRRLAIPVELPPISTGSVPPSAPPRDAVHEAIERHFRASEAGRTTTRPIVRESADDRPGNIVEVPTGEGGAMRMQRTAGGWVWGGLVQEAEQGPMPRVARGIELDFRLPVLPPIKPVRHDEVEEAESAPMPRRVASRPDPRRESAPRAVPLPEIPPSQSGSVPPEDVPEVIPDRPPTPIPEVAPAPRDPQPVVPRLAHPASNLHMTIRIGHGAPRFEVRAGDTGEMLVKASAEKVEFKRPIGSGDNGPPVGMRAFGRVTFSGPGVEGACDELSFTEAGEMMLKGRVSVRTKTARNWSEMAAESLILQIGGQAVGTTRTVPGGY